MSFYLRLMLAAASLPMLMARLSDIVLRVEVS